MRGFAVLTASLLCAAAVSQAWAAAPTAVVIEGSGLDWREARRIVELYGGQVVHALPPYVVVGDVPPAALDALRAGRSPGRTWDGARIRAAADAGEAKALTSELVAAAGKGAAVPAEIRAALSFVERPEASPAALAASPAEGLLDVAPAAASFGVAAPRPAAPLSAITGHYNTSDFLSGDIAVGIVRPESNGAADGVNANDWTDAEVADTLTELLAANDLLAGAAPAGRVAFVYRTESAGSGVAGTVPCGYEAANYQNLDFTVLQDIFTRLGYNGADGRESFVLWVNALRDAFKTDWAIGYVIVDDSASPSPYNSAFPLGPGAWFKRSARREIYFHETAHIWGARDEYGDGALTYAELFGGYMQVVNANSENKLGHGYFSGAGEALPSLMLDTNHYIDPWARGQMGLQDRDGDGVYDPEDTFPVVALDAAAGSPVVVAGRAAAGVLPRETPVETFLSTGDVAINRIARVEWRLNGGPWQDAAAADGAFDSASEAFVCALPPLKNGGYVLEARATDNFGQTTQRLARRDFVVSGSSLADNAPFAVFAVEPRLGGLGTTTFRFDAAGSSDEEDGSSALEYRFDLDGDGTFESGWSSAAAASRSFSDAGERTARVEVRDHRGATAVREVHFAVASAAPAPTARFTTGVGMKYDAQAPVTFHFDASGSSDAETPASALEVRWDFDGDGIWDTPFSTVKTVDHDYSLQPSIVAAQESMQFYWRTSGQPVMAQSFTTTTTRIDAVAVRLAMTGGAGAGQTITVGIKSSRNGDWLAWATRPQSEIVHDAFNRYAFPTLAVTPGATYYLVVATSDATPNWAVDTNNPYAGGSFSESSDGGATWTDRPTHDKVFRVYGLPLQTVPLEKSKVWTVRVKVRDAAGRTAVATRHVAANSYDHPPTAGIDVQWRAPATYDVTCQGADQDGATDWDGFLAYRVDGDGDGDFEGEYTSDPHRVVQFDRSGVYPVTCDVRDRFGATASAVYTLYVAPTLAGIALEDRATGSTTSSAEREVLVRFDAGRAPLEMMLSEDPSFAGASWRPYRPAAVFRLSPGAGPKTVYAKVRSLEDWNGAGPVSATIGVAAAEPSLTVTKVGADVALHWSGAAFDYSVYRSAAPDFASREELRNSPATGTGVLDAGAAADGAVWFYRVENDPL